MLPLSDLGVILLLSAHAATTLVMVGVIWMCQLVHYPLFVRIPGEVFADYERAHMRRISLIVGPAMGLELGTGVLIFLFTPYGIPAWLAGLALFLIGVNTLSTALLQGPTHRRLAAGFDARRIRFLVATNWIRTIAWSLRGAIALAMLALAQTPTGAT
jgi:hypothetical protein